MTDEMRTDAGHRVLPHGADVTIEAWASTRSGCLDELVRGLVETFADTRDATPTREVPVEVGAARDEDVVVTLLDDVGYLLDADGLVLIDIALEEEAEDGNFDGMFDDGPIPGAGCTDFQP